MSDSKYEKPISINEMRRRAPLHFLAKADNAAFTAKLLHSLPENTIIEFAGLEGYSGTPTLAIIETIRRESAISLELIIKANIAILIENSEAADNVKSVRMTHDVHALWGEAALPKIDATLRKQLIYAREVLEWSGRYAAPRNDASDNKIRKELEAVDPKKKKPSFEIKIAEYYNFEGYLTLYKIAAKTFWSRSHYRS